MRAPTSLSLLAVTALFLAGCPDVVKNVTSLDIEVTWEQNLAIDHLAFSVIHDGQNVGEPVTLPEKDKTLKPPGESLVILMPLAIAGDDVQVRVDGLSGGQVVATGVRTARVLVNTIVEVSIHLGDPAECGNGTLEGPAETCDDGDTDDQDGCSALCLVEAGWDCDDESPTVCIQCGNGTCEPGEDVCNCDDDCDTATCGDGECCVRGAENPCTCPEDCGDPVCGDSLCCTNEGEDTCACQQDCGVEICGNESCCANTGETVDTCEQDCATGCGDGACLGGESTCTCPEDCGAPVCGDAICCGGVVENTCSCPADCGDETCGNDICCLDQNEDACECPNDCPPAAQPCGDQICCDRDGENICTCPDDCGGPSTCNDGFCCPPDEDENTCPEDCSFACDDGTCNSGEDFCNCPEDCDPDTCLGCVPAVCGDGSCCADAPEPYREDACTCPSDCGLSSCPDGICCEADGENPCTCAADCGTTSCGDGFCCPDADPPEDICSCPVDCGEGFCGDGVCCHTPGDDTCSCPEDCGAPVCGDDECCGVPGDDPCDCPEDCGDPLCGDDNCCPTALDPEDTCSCADDCGEPTCGDGECCDILGDNTCDCPGDCLGGGCGDGICCALTNESEATCPQDCGAAQCGNGVVDPPDETCDDGDTDSGDGCSATCTIETGDGWICLPGDPSCCKKCGNGTIECDEACDGQELNGMTCWELALLREGGSLGCSLDCLSYDTNTCGNPIRTCATAQDALNEVYSAPDVAHHQVISLKQATYRCAVPAILDECQGACTGGRPFGVTVQWDLGSPQPATFVPQAGNTTMFQVITGNNVIQEINFVGTGTAIALEAGADAGGNRIHHNRFIDTLAGMAAVQVDSAANTIEANQFLGAEAATAIRVAGADNTVSMNVIQGPFDPAIQFEDAVGSGRLDHNSIWLLGGLGVRLDGTISLCARNNVVAGDGTSTGWRLAEGLLLPDDAGCGGTTSLNNSLVGHLVTCEDSGAGECAAACDGGLPLCDLALEPGFSGPGLCLDAASPLIDPASGVSLDYDLVDATVDGQDVLFINGVPDIGAREHNAARRFGSVSTTCGTPSAP